MSQVKNIAIVGGAGQCGSPILKFLLASGRFVITAITREESPSTFPSGTKIVRGDYSDSFLEFALQNQDALIILLAGAAPEEIQSRLIKAAAAASVPWVLPNEWGPDSASRQITEALPPLGAKQKYRDEIEALGKSSWIGVINGLWFDVGLKTGFTGFNIKERTARIYGDGTVKSSTSTLAQVGQAVTKLFELPADKLLAYKNRFLYVDSFRVSHADILNSLKKATGAEDWKVTKVPVDEAIAGGKKQIQSGDRKGFIDVLYGLNFKPGAGGNFEHKSDNKTLGLEEEDLDEVVRNVVKNMETI